MIPIHTVLGLLVLLFAVVGSLRGWAKEIIVAFSVFLALFVEHVLLTFVPPLRDLFYNLPLATQFYVRASLFVIITTFGYASPSIATRLGAKVVRERLQDLLLGFFLGLLNGFLVVGTLLFFLDAAYYGVAENMRYERTRLDELGQPVLDAQGNVVIETVYDPEAVGIGGIVPPGPTSPAVKLLPFCAPAIAQRSNAVLYLAVAASFVFVIVVFI